ncbi:MAG TPA: sodium:proton antiporter [Thermodesulfovibrionales bacterium]|nr:sodium:proton antiporter [Thermodesulfovibrionales bacterium]
MESAISFEMAKQMLFSFAIILAAGAISGFLSQKINLPDVAIYLVAGIILGPEVTGLLHVPAEAAMNQIILIFGACYILFDGGASVNLNVLKKIWITLVALSTFGVLIMGALTGLASHYVLGLPLITSMLLGAAIAPTDPATIIPVFRQVRIKERVSQALISESAFNDATGSVITFAVLSIAMGSTDFSLTISLTHLLKQSVVGIIIGLVMGYLGLLLIAHEKYDFLAKYAPVVTLMAVVGTYLGAEGLHAGGFIAVFVFGIMFGNKRAFGFQMEQEEKKKLEEYVARTAMIMRMFIFILLGSQVDFDLISKFLLGGIIIITLFMLVARPTTVFLCSLPDRLARWSLNEMLFMSWTRETGVIPAALAGLLLGRKVPGAQTIAAVTFIAILMTILIQATTTKWIAAKLGLLEE